MPRSFIAIRIAPPPSALLEAAAPLARMGRAVKAIEPQNLHITLRFLGDTDEAMLALVSGAVREAVDAAKLRAFSFELAGVGAFPHEQRPSVVWAGGRDDQPVHALVAAMTPLLDTLDFVPETRPWTTHLTLARVKARPPRELHDLLARHRETSFGRVTIEQVELITSELLPSGPRYTTVDHVRL